MIVDEIIVSGSRRIITFLSDSRITFILLPTNHPLKKIRKLFEILEMKQLRIIKHLIEKVQFKKARSSFPF